MTTVCKVAAFAALVGLLAAREWSPLTACTVGVATFWLTFSWRA